MRVAGVSGQVQRALVKRSRIKAQQEEEEEGEEEEEDDEEEEVEEEEDVEEEDKNNARGCLLHCLGYNDSMEA